MIELIIFCQMVAGLAVTVVFLHLVADAWSKRGTCRHAALAVRWGFALGLITFWRTAAWADLLWQLKPASPLDRDVGIAVVVWGIAAAACSSAAIFYYRDRDRKES